MGQVRFTRLARIDLLDLWGHIAERNPVAADAVLDRIEASCRDLRDFPLFGRARPDIGDGARMLVIERWLALYRVLADDVQVVRIVDGARDLKRLSWPDRSPTSD